MAQRIYELASNLDLITPELVKQIGQTQDIYKLLGADYGSSQQMQAMQTVLGKVAEINQREYEKQTQQLKSLNPYFDPQKYYFPADKVYNPGEGAAANRSAPVDRMQIQIREQQKALNRATQAAKTYQQTGQFPAYPSPSQLIQETFGLSYTPEQEAKILAKAGISGKVSDADIAEANAAAARVGAPLPYPGGKIGNVSNGGLFQNGQEAAQFYDPTTGQLDQKKFQEWSATVGGTKKLPGQEGTPGVGGIPGGTPGAQGSPGTPGTGSGAPGGTLGGGASNAKQAALDILKNSGLDEGTRMFYEEVLKNWNPDMEVNEQNILNSFQKIKQTTIDPHYQQLADIATDQVKSAYAYTKAERDRQLEIEGANAAQGVSNAQNNLEASGLLFSGKAVEQLGAKSPFAQEGTPEAAQSAIPLQEKFGGKYAEGLVNMQNRLVSTSSLAQYNKNLQDMSRQTEQYLGSDKSKGIIPEVSQLGGIKGSLEEQKQQELGSTLGSLVDQQKVNQAALKPVVNFNG